MKKDATKTKIEKLERENKELQRHLEQRGNLLNHISHDVRNFAQATHNFTNLMLNGWEKIQTSKRRELVESIKKSSDCLMSLVTHMLDESSLKAGKITYRFAEVELGELISKVIIQSTIYLYDKQLKVLFENKNDKALVQGDSVQLTRVLHNLFSNAGKYAKDHSTLIVSLSSMRRGDNEYWQCSLSNQGAGIVASDLEVVFEPFTRSDYLEHAEGKGLGLAICKEIITAHQGEIWAESHNFGTIFNFILPALS